MRIIHLRNALFAVALLLPGCSRAPTSIERDNRRLVDAVLTAITLKNSRLLEENAGRTKTCHDEGKLTDKEYEGLVAVIDEGRRGDWLGAEKDGYSFRKEHPFVMEGH